MKTKLLRLSYSLHKWIGVYVTVLTIIWLVELFLLPLAFSPKNEEGRPSVSKQSAGGSESMISLQELIFRVRSGEYGPPPSDMEILYQPKKRIYTICDRKNFINIRVNAHSGERMDIGLDHDNLFKEKSGLGWIHSAVGFVLKSPFEIAFIILSLTGAYLFLFSYLKRAAAKKHGILGMRPSQKFIYHTTKNQKDMRRLAALGLLPGVSVTILHMPARAPVILSALHTRIAISRDIAATIIASEEGV